MEIFLQIFQFQHMITLVVGIIIGIIVGVLPGLTPTMGVALLIPFTFSLSPVNGILLLGGIYSGSVYGGSVPAILFNIPGAPASVATTFDGYPMARLGKARKALEIATISSTIGGLFGMVVLLFFAPILAKFSLQFGPTENFWIAIFGLTVIAAISEGSTTKNLLGGAFGILLSFIGINTFTGTTRFTMGINDLVGGLNIVAVLIGLFAFPQALRLIEEITSKSVKQSTMNSNQKSSILHSLFDVLRRGKSLTLGSLIGAIIGVLPGAGGNIASILAYNEVKRFSKKKEQFGKGIEDGIIASESANNAMVGGSLVPLLTLGIPGSPTAAIFLGGLLIHGIWPGRNLFVDNALVANTFLYGMLTSQFLLLIIGLLTIPILAKLVKIPKYFMVPVIIVFSIFGSFTTQNNVFDIYTMVAIGIFMFILEKFKFSAPPIALGFILGPIAEEGLLQGIAIGSANGNPFLYFVDGTWNIILILLTISTVGYSIWQIIKKRKHLDRKSNANFYIHLKNMISLRSGIWMGIILLTGMCYISVLDLTKSLRIFPQIILLSMLLLSIIQYIQGILDSTKHSLSIEKMKRSTFALLLIIIGISFLTNIIGFYIQALILMITVPLYVYLPSIKRKKIYYILFVSTSFTMVIYLIFGSIIKIPLP